MASFDGRQLALDAAGAVLFLKEAARASRREVFTTGVLVHSIAGLHSLVVEGLRERSAERVCAEAPEWANRALDRWVMQGDDGNVLSEPLAKNIAWWHDQDRIVLRILATSRMGWGSFAAGAPGSSVSAGASPGPSPGTWHKSFRYFRMSETTDDLFDAFRNLYLALESILSDLEPVQPTKKGGWEPEFKWLLRALKAAQKHVNLNDYLLSATSDPVQGVIDELYKTIRTSVFHAKNGRPVLLPQDQGDRPLVVGAKERYTRLYLDLVALCKGVRFPTGGLSQAGFEVMYAALEQLQVVVTGDVEPLGGMAPEPLASDGSPALPMSTSRAPDLEGAGGMALLARGRTADLQPLPRVGRFGAVFAGGELGVAEHLGVVDLGDVDQLEVVLLIHGLNVRNPRSNYGT